MESLLKYKVAFLCIMATILGFYFGGKHVIQARLGEISRSDKQQTLLQSGTASRKRMSYTDMEQAPVINRKPPHSDVSNDEAVETSGMRVPSTAVDQSPSATVEQRRPQPELPVDEAVGMKISSAADTEETSNAIGKETPLQEDAPNDGTPGTELPSSFMRTICSQKSRVALYKSVCVKHNPDEKVRELILDPDTKTAVCINKKAGSMSWQTLLMKNKNLTFTRSSEGFVADQESYGFFKLEEYSSTSVSNKYGDWVKYIVVRHPLQRLVSGYYQIQVGKVVDENGVTMMPRRTFLEFAQGLVNGNLANTNPHWMEYNLRCRVCHIDYEFIVKQETIEQDIELFKELYGLRKDVKMQTGTGNMWVPYNSTTRSFKYDEMLGKFQDKHPDLMHGLLKLYGYDMELFGYGWDWDQRKSYCWNSADSGCC